jgi:murein L,D-transpeptidase YcbB/YkuD
MKSNMRALALLAATGILISGCATAKPRPPEQTDANNQVAQLQNEIQAKDQQIQDLQYQVESSQQAIKTNFSRHGRADKKSIIQVDGVSPIELQKALVRAGYNPGPVDGHIGKKTKAAVRKFQRKHGLPADGFVGEKTWAYLKS